MTQVEKQQFIDSELKQLWPQWNWTPATLRVWFGILNNFEYLTARESIEQVYAQGLATYQKQLVPVFCKIAKNAMSGTEDKEKDEPVLDYKLRCIAHEERPEMVGHEDCFYSPQQSKRTNAERLMTFAQRKMKLAEGIYGGKWIVINELEEVPF